MYTLEYPTNDLRFELREDGRYLQQQWVINEIDQGMPVSQTKEWRDVPCVAAS